MCRTHRLLAPTGRRVTLGVRWEKLKASFACQDGRRPIKTETLSGIWPDDIRCLSRAGTMSRNCCETLITNAVLVNHRANASNASLLISSEPFLDSSGRARSSRMLIHPLLHGAHTPFAIQPEVGRGGDAVSIPCTSLPCVDSMTSSLAPRAEESHLGNMCSRVRFATVVEQNQHRGIGSLHLSARSTACRAAARS